MFSMVWVNLLAAETRSFTRVSANLKQYRKWDT